MKILAVEFSSEQRSAAVLDATGRVAGRAARKGGRAVIELVEEALRQAGCEREEMDVVAVGLGPGSYTGIRGAIAMAQGWQLARSIRLLGISSIECMVLQAQAEGIFGSINIIVDAQREEFYAVRYEINTQNCAILEPLRLTSMAEIKKMDNLAGPDIRKWFANGIDLYPDAAALGRLAIGREDFAAGESLEPIYLRQTDFKKAAPSRQQA